jgi:glycosyltransferase involved in cell wall biosynthesis
VVPVYNEEKTIGKILEKLYKVDFGKIKLEVVVVNDGSSDGTLKVLNNFSKKYPIKKISYSENVGKGWALRIGFKETTGEVITIQDGDLEYEPSDFSKMLKKMSDSNVRVVYGSRRLNKKNNRNSGIIFLWGGLALTWIANILYGGKLTDEPTCYKMFESKLLKSLDLKSKRFESCSEITAKILRKGINIYEVPIAYYPRSAIEGKKIRLKDFFENLGALLKYRAINEIR